MQYVLLHKFQQNIFRFEIDPLPKFDVEKAKPILFTSAAKYLGIGERVGDAFSTGKVINPAKVEEARKQFRMPPPPED